MPSDVRDAGRGEGVRVLLVRHGETVWNQENRWQGQADTPLSQTGYDQARQLARRLQNEERPIRAIYTSDLSRARDTADILGQVLGSTPLETAAWREMDIGTWSGLTTSEVATRHAEEWARLRQGEDLPRGGGETFAQFQGRLAAIESTLYPRPSGRTDYRGDPRRCGAGFPVALSWSGYEPIRPD